MLSYLNKVFKNLKSKRSHQPYKKIVSASHAYTEALSGLTTEEFKSEVAKLRSTVASSDIEALLGKGLALACEAASRSLGKRPYPTQELAAIGLYHGRLVEMGTGEGKTLVAPLAAFLTNLAGMPGHIVTANEYLAHRDAQAMLPLYTLLGMSVGVLSANGEQASKQQVYRCDVVYGAHNTFVVDYLNDQQVLTSNAILQRTLGFAIVDEADAVLIDEARTPVTLASYHASDVFVYQAIAKLAAELQKTDDASGDGDFWIDGQERVVLFTEAGYEKVDLLLTKAGLLDPKSLQYGSNHQAMLTKVQHALAAQFLQIKDHHYTVKDGAIVLIDEISGRLLPGNTWTSGLQQALETKEGLALSPESTPRATISRQNYFRLYERLSGMTGTATQEAEEFEHIYGLGVMAIAPVKPCIRVDHPARIFRTQSAKMLAVVDDVCQRHTTGQPVLIGTASVEQSEELAKLLVEKGLAPVVLNAKNHEKEAEIIACAGKLGTITVTTSMAGRGVDIPLGGHLGLELYHHRNSMGPLAWEQLGPDGQKALRLKIEQSIEQEATRVREVGGLFVLGLERYETRRMDRQLQGRAGRQGDPGETSFFISLEDPMIENFAGEYLRGMLSVMDISAGSELESKVVAKAVDGAQKQVEGRAFSTRKNILKFDDILNDQRKALYSQRRAILTEEKPFEVFQAVLNGQLDELVRTIGTDADLSETWNLDLLRERLSTFTIELPSNDELVRYNNLSELTFAIQELAKTKLESVLSVLSSESRNQGQAHLARMALLYGLDKSWAMHLEALDHTRQGIHLRAHAKESPLESYKKEAYALFSTMLSEAKQIAINTLYTWRPDFSEN